MNHNNSNYLMAAAGVCLQSGPYAGKQLEHTACHWHTWQTTGTPGIRRRAPASALLKGVLANASGILSHTTLPRQAAARLTA